LGLTYPLRLACKVRDVSHYKHFFTYHMQCGYLKTPLFTPKTGHLECDQGGLITGDTFSSHTSSNVGLSTSNIWKLMIFVGKSALIESTLQSVIRPLRLPSLQWYSNFVVSIMFVQFSPYKVGFVELSENLRSNSKMVLKLCVQILKWYWSLS
jgi:hypothetical protein